MKARQIKCCYELEKFGRQVVALRNSSHQNNLMIMFQNAIVLLWKDFASIVKNVQLNQAKD